MTLVDPTCRLPTGRPHIRAVSATIRAAGGVIREAALGLGKAIIVGGIVAAAAVHGHGLVACELSQAPKAMAAVVPVATTERRPMKLVIPGQRPRIERRAPVYDPIPSRRIILQ